MTNHIIETVTFKLASGISKEAFLKTIPLSTTFVQSRPGFISRHLSCSDDGNWIEHIEWASLGDAKSASDAFMQDQSLMPFMQCIDGPSAVMRHSQLEVSIS